MKNTEKENIAQSEITFGKLTLQALPQMWVFQVIAAVISFIPAILIMDLIDWVAGIGIGAITTANIKAVILSWKMPVILLLGILLIFVFMVLEIFAQIYLTNNILNGQNDGIIKCIRDGLRAVKRFLNPSGLVVILFIFIAGPLCGVGFTISLSETFYIPNFIMEVVLKSPLLATVYVVLILLLIWIAVLSIYTLHAILLDGMTPSEGRAYSGQLVKKHWGIFLKRFIVNVALILGIIFLSNVILYNIPHWLLGGIGESLPKDRIIDFGGIFENHAELSNDDVKLIVYRAVAAFVVMVSKYLIYLIPLLCGAYLMLRLNRDYLEYTGRGRDSWPQRPKNKSYIRNIVIICIIFVVFGVTSVVIGLYYDPLYTREENVKIVAHRAGGTMAPENSIEGLKKAIEHNCYACEIDVQRTKDGYYIINHDNDFKRLTGVEKTPGEMTLEEIKKLRIKDTTGSGNDAQVVTLEEMLDVIKGKVKLFVELKGVSADRQMVDDVARIIKEHDCVEDTALISLDYSIIDYANTNYPEFETGTLFFASLGDVSKLNCDLLIMEEESATDNNIETVHNANKQVIVWTVNTFENMYKFLDSDIDGVITDEVILSEEVQAILDDRTDLEVLQDKI
ncbi:MAG: glycerophosphoryl diester phosphodiesterase membrane domain-containing protein [Lachnospiraceae bacterium]|nr:glycerophosphoryl diester phosphodiesterase membrane domain-containing protein [Lachnospiraceae bacterium]